MRNGKNTWDEPTLNLVDANFHRAKEAVRVLEDIARFHIRDKIFSSSFKNMRHALTRATLKVVSNAELARSRCKKDIGERIHSVQEKKRSSVHAIACANFSRAQEALRVLEEFYKLKNSSAALTVKSLRYKCYRLEKKMIVLLNEQ